MLVQFYQPEHLDPEELDYFLARGWFRNSLFLHNSRVISLQDEIHDIYNIRFRIQGYTPRKSLRKILRKADDSFSISFGSVSFTPEKERLYQQHLHNFQGFLFESLEHFLNGYLSNSAFETREICVYNNEELVAYSLYDVGKNSIASLLGIYQETYAKYSLGIYTMLLEMKKAQELGFDYYYPGYVLSNTTDFDYKLRIGNAEYLQPDLTWGTREELENNVLAGEVITQKTNRISTWLNELGIVHKMLMNPFYSMGYGHFNNQNYCKAMKLAIIELSGVVFGLEYDYEESQFQLSRLKKDAENTRLLVMSSTLDLSDEEVYLPYLVEYKEIISKSPILEELEGIVQSLVRQHI